MAVQSLLARRERGKNPYRIHPLNQTKRLMLLLTPHRKDEFEYFSISLCSQDKLIIGEETGHACTPNTNKVIIDDVIGRMQKRAREETIPIPKIYSEEMVKARVENPGIGTGTIFPLLDKIDASLYRRRAQNYVKLPATLEEINLIGTWRLDKNGGEFLLVDEKYGGDYLMIFGSEWSIRLLSSCSIWHSDGTFDVHPLLFAKLYIIFDFNNGYMIPCAYCLTTKKNEIAYTKILNH
ncbi:unnamed protein product [Didymodactylos carnosus]|uniref:Uncharacterized protein n=1 Tax=Didymodactylos carnosus TaxID=1234261 RepID=A0A815QUW9_9BILA|nr:unnamed protein product [Didymodactylos carnosus]CAF1468244.1 unnamed protein product [Didymodactylos carnosus]CAF3775937.1 unnamed protein product [Didymodactylos carnosus]CAF4336813.1 unnamed protein product [Didymodactylos carnosus]